MLCLQDASLQATAESWQQTVHKAYHSAVKPFFSHMDAAHSSSSNATMDTIYHSCSLQEWLWAVAVVESRAFGAARADVAAAETAAGGGSSSKPQTATVPAPNAANFTGLVPVLDLANHTHRPPYEHRLDPSTATFSLFVDCSQSQRDCSAAALMSGSSSSSSDSRRQEVQQQQQQVLITYGSKDNRCDRPGKLAC